MGFNPCFDGSVARGLMLKKGLKSVMRFQSLF